MNNLAAVLREIRTTVLALTDDSTESREYDLLSLVYRDGVLALYERRGDHKLPDQFLRAFEHIV